MAQLLRQVVAAPRIRHEDTGLDLCYVTENIIATAVAVFSSGPSQTYPRRAYRTPLDRLVRFLDEKHGDKWAIWEFRAEGTGYPDEAVYGRIHHFPWPDHHPPPFRLVPLIMGTMKNWLNGGELNAEGDRKSKNEKIVVALPSTPASEPGTAIATQDGIAAQPSTAPTAGSGAPRTNGPGSEFAPNPSNPTPNRIAVVHCKAGKGRSGSMSVSYLISECGWAKADAMGRFTERRMLPGFGTGVSIPSQVRWIDYVERWAKNKRYIDRPVEVVEVHCWGLRNGVKMDVQGFVDEGRKIKVFHSFTKEERVIIEGNPPGGGGIADMVMDMMADGKVGSDTDSTHEDAKEGRVADNGTEKDKDGVPKRTASKLLRKGRNAAKAISRFSKPAPQASEKASNGAASGTETPKSSSSSESEKENKSEEPGGQAVIFKPNKPIILNTSDINISLERRSRAPVGVGLSVTTAVAHAWLNAFFEGEGPERLARVPEEQPLESGVFGVDWDKMDGLKGSKKKGARALDRMEVVWRLAPAAADDAAAPAREWVAAAAGEKMGKIEEINEPKAGEVVKEPGPADWRGEEGEVVDPDAGKRLGVPVDEEEGEKKDDTNAQEAQKRAGEAEAAKDAVDEDEDMDELNMVKSAGPKGEKI